MKLLILVLLLCCQGSVACAAGYAVASNATPVLNTPAFDRIFRNDNTLKQDRCGQVREMEFIALPGTTFTILEVVGGAAGRVLRVTTSEYPTTAGTSLYVDRRFVTESDTLPRARERLLPDRTAIADSLREAIGLPYVWGGNVSSGVTELARYFYRTPLPPARQNSLLLKGLDCSGLLYQATNGYTPRNTSELVSFGQPVTIQGHSAADIARKLQPLDLIVWKGHVVIVLDGETAIESRLECGAPSHGGVVATPLLQRLKEVMRTRRPADRWPAGGKQGDLFVVRRWL